MTLIFLGPNFRLVNFYHRKIWCQLSSKLFCYQKFRHGKARDGVERDRVGWRWAQWGGIRVVFGHNRVGLRQGQTGGGIGPQLDRAATG